MAPAAAFRISGETAEAECAPSPPSGMIRHASATDARRDVDGAIVDSYDSAGPEGDADRMLNELYSAETKAMTSSADELLDSSSLKDGLDIGSDYDGRKRGDDDGRLEDALTHSSFSTNFNAAAAPCDISSAIKEKTRHVSPPTVGDPSFCNPSHSHPIPSQEEAQSEAPDTIILPPPQRFPTQAGTVPIDGSTDYDVGRGSFSSGLALVSIDNGGWSNGAENVTNMLDSTADSNHSQNQAGDDEPEDENVSGRNGSKEGEGEDDYGEMSVHDHDAVDIGSDDANRVFNDFDVGVDNDQGVDDDEDGDDPNDSDSELALGQPSKKLATGDPHYYLGGGVGIKKPAGRVGLGNLGNTCFMNSTLQCLAHTDPLREYFASGKFEEDLNPDNPLGTGGELAMKFAILMRQMWGNGSGNGMNSSKARGSLSSNGDGGPGHYAASSYSSNRSYLYGNGGSLPSNASVVYPREFKYTLGKHASQFMGYDQHDSQELATYLLDALHEDVNKILSKPYVEKPEQEEGESDREAARKAWELHLRREDSEVLDVCMGQSKSKVTCPNRDCNRVSTTFDPFMYLSVPIPGATDRVLSLTYVPLDPLRRMRRINVTVAKTATVGKLREEVAKVAGIDNAADLALADVWNREIFTYYSDQDEVWKIRDTDETYVYELYSSARIRAEEEEGHSDGDLSEGVDRDGRVTTEAGGSCSGTGGKKKEDLDFLLDIPTELRLSRGEQWIRSLETYTKLTLLNALLNTRKKTHAERIEFADRMDAFIAQCKKCPDAALPKARETSLEESSPVTIQDGEDGYDVENEKKDDSAVPRSPKKMTTPQFVQSYTQVDGSSGQQLSLSETSEMSNTFRNVDSRHDLLVLDYCAWRFRQRVAEMQREKTQQNRDGVVVQVLFKREAVTGGAGRFAAGSSAHHARFSTSSYHNPLHPTSSSSSVSAGERSFAAPLLMRISPRLTVHGFRRLVSRRLLRCLRVGGNIAAASHGVWDETSRTRPYSSTPGGECTGDETSGDGERRAGSNDLLDEYGGGDLSAESQSVALGGKTRGGNGTSSAASQESHIDVGGFNHCGNAGEPSSSYEKLNSSSKSAPLSAPRALGSGGSVVSDDERDGGYRSLFLLNRVPLTYQCKGVSAYSMTTPGNRLLGSLETGPTSHGHAARPDDAGESDLVVDSVGKMGVISLHWPYAFAGGGGADNSGCFDVLEWETLEEPTRPDGNGAITNEGANQWGGEQQVKKKTITVLDCVEKYCQMEQLEETEMWYCNRCKDHVRAWKQMHIFLAPRILILHLKRFQISASTRRRDKIDILVEFPLEGLDLRKYVQHWNEGEEPIYDCYAVSNHFGGLGGGHYTAYALNHGEWCNFDDSKVTEGVNKSEVVSSAAYVLYYRRRDSSHGSIGSGGGRIVAADGVSSSSSAVSPASTSPLPPVFSLVSTGSREEQLHDGPSLYLNRVEDMEVESNATDSAGACATPVESVDGEEMFPGSIYAGADV